MNTTYEELQVELEALKIENKSLKSLYELDIAEHRHIEEEKQLQWERLARQQDILLEIATSPFVAAGDVQSLSNLLTECVSQYMNVERVSVWLFDKAETQLRCIDLFELSLNRHSSGAVLNEIEFQNEFAALKSSKYIDASNPLTDRRTAGFAESYIIPGKISAMLSGVIHFSNKTLGAFCIEYVRNPHSWTTEEISFACQLSDQIAITLSNYDRLQVEENLRNERLLLRTVIDNLPNSIYCKDLTGHKTLTNTADMLYSHFTSEYQVLGKTDFDLYPQKLAEGFYADDQLVMQTGRAIINKEEFILDENGQKQWLLTSKLPLKDGNGNVIGLVGFGNNITDRKLAELEQQVFYEITHGVTTTTNLSELLKLIHQSLTKVLYADNCFVALYDEKTGLFNFPYFVDKFDPKPEPVAMHKSCSAYVFRTGKPLLLTRQLFNELVEKDEVELVGSNSPSWLGVPLESASKILGVLVLQHYEDANIYTERDLQFLYSVGNQIALAIERKMADDQLRESEEMFRRLFNDSADSILLLTESGFSNCNPATLAQLGYSTKEEFLSKQPWEISPERQPDGRLSSEKAQEIINRAIVDGFTRFEWLHIKSDGSELPVEVMLTSILIKGKQVLYTIWRDMTEHKIAENEIDKKNKQLVELNSEKDKLFSIIAHDLRSPFHGLLGLTNIMATDSRELSPDQIEKYSITLSKSVANLYRLLENLLEWGQMQKGSISFTPEELELSDIFLQCIDSVKEMANQKGITIDFEIPESRKIYADEKMISAVIRNLLSNAVKFTKNSGKVIVKSKKREDGVIEISVTDSGIGISAKIVDKLFKLGEKVSTRGTENEPSTGLGLLLCKEFVEKHNGTIWVESQEGVGSTFYFTLPAVIAPLTSE